MDFKLLFIFVLVSCVYINAQVISSLSNSGQVRKNYAPCGCQGLQIEVPSCRCGIPIAEPIYRAPATCGCRQPAYFEPTCGCGFDLPASLFSFETPYGVLAPEVCGCRKPAVKLSNSYDYFTEIPICSCQKVCGCQANPCRCQASPCACQSKPCGSQTSAVPVPVNIFDFLTALDLPYGCQSAIQINYEYVSPVVEYLNCGCRIPVPEIPKCGCQIPKTELPSCGCGKTINYLYEYSIPVLDLPCGCIQMDVPNYPCQYHPVYYAIDMPKCGCQVPLELAKLCGCQNSPCGCQNSPCGCQNSPCGCLNYPCGCQNSPCGCLNSPCGCLNSPCGSQDSPCGCQNSPCGCQNSPCGCQNSPCGCQSSPYGFQNTLYECQSSPCGCGKYLRQITLQPPFL